MTGAIYTKKREEVLNVQIQMHLVAVLPALLLAVFILLRKKGTESHKLLGRVWTALMFFTALSSFFILSNGQFSWIHILSVVTIVSVGLGVWAIKHGRVRMHYGCMGGAFIGAIIAGVFAAIIPGRVVYNFLFGSG